MKKLLAVILAGMMALAVAGCGGGDKKAEAPKGGEAKASTVVRVAYMPNMGSAATLFTGIEQGYFKEVGIEVKPFQFQGGPAEIAAMGSGDIDVAQIGHGAHKLCIQGQAKIFHMDGTSLADAVVANKSKGINKVADLKGKTVAVQSGTSSEIILKLALADAGLSLNDLKTVEMDANGMVTAIVSGKIDACATWSPSTITIKQGLKDNYLVLADNNTYVSKVTFPSSFITTDKYAKEHKDTLVKFSQALYKAQNYRKAHIDDVAKMLAKKLEVPEKTMLASTGEGNWLDSAFFKKALADGTVQKYYENQQKVFLDSGAIKEKVDVNKYVLFDIMKEAYANFEKSNSGK